MLLTDLTNTALALVLTVASGGTGVTGLSITVRLRDGETTNSYLDFADNTFKTSGWTTQDAALSEIGDGHYQRTLDVSAIVGLAIGDSLVAEYHNAASPPLDQSEVIIVEELQRVALTFTANAAGGVTGLAAGVKVRDATTLNKYLDWDDNAFKTIGWVQLIGTMAEISRGHYHRLFDVTLATGFSGAFVAEYHATGSGFVLDSNDDPVGLPLLAVADVNPPVVTLVSPADGSPVAESTPIVLKVEDDVGLAHIGIDVTFPSGISEAIYDGIRFKPAYDGGSTIVAIAGGFQFTLRRAFGGWPATLAINIEAIDTAGNRNVS